MGLSWMFKYTTKTSVDLFIKQNLAQGESLFNFMNSCDLCDEWLSQNGNLNRHMRTKAILMKITQIMTYFMALSLAQK